MYRGGGVHRFRNNFLVHPLQQREGVVRSVGWQTFALWLYLFACLSTQKSTLRHSSLTSLLVSSTDQETIKSLRWKQLPLHSHWLRFFGFSPVSAHIEQCIMFKFIQSHTGHTDNTDSTPSQWRWPVANQCPLISLYSSPVLSQKLAKWPRISHSGHIVTDSLTSC